MHRQRQGASSLRVRRQGVGGDDAACVKGRPVRDACEGDPGSPLRGHTLDVVIPEMEQQVAATIKRIVADRGYRGHNAPEEHKFRFSSPVRDGVSLRRLSASCGVAPPSNQSSAT
jgi:hypothetical protein